MNKRKEETRRLAIERSEKSKRREEMRQRSRKDEELEDDSDGWGIDILGFLWPEQNDEEKIDNKEELHQQL